MLLVIYSQVHAIQKSARIDILAPAHFLISGSIGVGPFLDLKPSVKFQSNESFYFDLESDIGIFSRTIVTQYIESVSLDSAVSNGPEIIGSAYGVRGGLGKSLIDFGTGNF
jgi:hypothetical protein